MTASDPPSIRTTLKAVLLRAMKQRDREAALVYRAALGAIDNAETLPLGTEIRAGAIELSAVGVGRSDVPRRALTEHEMIAIVVGEARERSAAAGLVETTNPTYAKQLHREANLLLSFVHTPEAG